MTDYTAIWYILAGASVLGLTSFLASRVYHRRRAGRDRG